ncbi:MAG: acyltransferase [Clostridia bacterium]|nr:acyltransferase [Clostridia bacterium]
MEERRHNYDTVDLLKLVGSILIFTMHASALSSFNANAQFFGVQLLARWCVPFFFIASSYLLFRKKEGEELSAQGVWKYTRRILLLYAVWFVFNLPYVVYVRLYVPGLTDVKTWLFFIRDCALSSSFMGSWYLIGSLLGAWVVYLLAKKLPNWVILIVTGVTYAFCVATSLYSAFLPQEFTTFLNEYVASPCNSVIGGIFFFALGKTIADKKETFSKLPAWLYLALGLTSISLFYVEVIVVREFVPVTSTDAAVMLVPTALCLFLFAVQSPLKVKGARVMRKVSTVVYCAQGTAILAAQIGCRLLGFSHTFLSYAVACALLVALSAVVLLLQGKTRLQWPRYLT